MPLRLRLTLLFASALAVLLVVLGGLLYLRTANALDEQIDDGLEQHAASIGADTPNATLDDGFVAVVDRMLEVEGVPVSPDDLARARRDAVFVTLGGHRVLLTPREDGVLAVGRSLDDRDQALASLLAELLVVGALALVLAGAGGYVVARSAARPVVDRLERGLARERAFVADASHELRTPLATLQAELDVALRRQRSSDELAAALTSAREEVERLRRLADDLLVLARADRDDLELRRERLSALELLEGVRRRFAARAAANGRGVEVAAGDAELDGDRLRLEQALGNLVDNALRHGTGTVRLAAERRDGLVSLSVRDDGAGIPPELGVRAFERFTRGGNARGGSGLGLAIVDAVARAHGGTARASGSTVSIELGAQSSVK